MGAQSYRAFVFRVHLGIGDVTKILEVSLGVLVLWEVSWGLSAVQRSGGVSAVTPQVRW